MFKMSAFETDEVLLKKLHLQLLKRDLFLYTIIVIVYEFMN